MGRDKEKRGKRRKRSPSPKGLGEESGSEGEYDNAAAWVERSRKLEAQRKVAARMASQFDEMEEEQQQQASAYSSADLKGLAIQHDADTFKEGTEVILTLKDTNVLEEDEDVLENTNIAEEERRKSAIAESRAQTAAEVLEQGEGQDTVLSKYDERDKGPKLRLDDHGGLNREKEKQLELIRDKLKRAKKEVSLETEKRFNRSDYMTTEEASLKFKKVKKKKKKKMRKKNVEHMLAETKLDDTAADHGSRGEANSRKAGDEERTEKRDRFNKALDKANKKSLRLRESVAKVDVEDDGEAELDELESTLARTRKVTSRKKQDQEQVLALLESNAEAERKQVAVEEEQKQGDRIVLSETHEFCRTLQAKREERVSTRVAVKEKEKARVIAANKESKQRAMASAGGDATGDVVRGEVAMGEETRPSAAVQPAVDDDHDDNDDDKAEVKKPVVLDEEPVLQSGIAAALQYVKNKNLLAVEKQAGRAKDLRDPLGSADAKTGEQDIVLSYKDEFGREMTQKEAFRVLSHKFHGRKPGKKKQTQRLLRYYEELEQQRQQSDPSQQSQFLTALQAHQQRSGQAFVVVQQGNQMFKGNNATEPTVGKKPRK